MLIPKNIGKTMEKIHPEQSMVKLQTAIQYRRLETDNDAITIADARMTVITLQQKIK